MELKIIETEVQPIAELVSEDWKINTLQDALDLIGNADYQGARKIIVYEKQLNPDFFNLRTGLAGEILQKISNYRMQISIIGNFTNVESKSLNAFIIECNRGNTVFFVSSKGEAIKRLD